MRRADTGAAGSGWLLALVMLAWAGRAQGTLHITYDLSLDQVPPLQCRAELTYADGVSVFRWNNAGAGNQLATDEMGNMQIRIRDTDPTGSVNIADRRKDSLYSRGTLFNGAYLLAEPLPRIGWVLEPETRQLGGHTVHKARASFRGRRYTAWYSPEIPVPVGPWKLHGLPGAILEAYDEEAFIHMVFKALWRSPGLFVPDPELFAVERSVDLEGFREMQEGMAAELIRKIRSKLPRGAQMSVQETASNFLEREFGEQ